MYQSPIVYGRLISPLLVAPHFMTCHLYLFICCVLDTHPHTETHTNTGDESTHMSTHIQGTETQMHTENPGVSVAEDPYEM